MQLRKQILPKLNQYYDQIKKKVKSNVVAGRQGIPPGKDEEFK